jgi:hypothetical protein
MSNENKATPPKVSWASQAKNFFIGGVSGMTATCFVSENLLIRENKHT